MIYWVRSGDIGPVKVGYAATDVPARIKMLQCGSPLPLTVLRVEPGGRNVEAALHRHYRAKRLRAEWFLLAEADVAVDLSDLAPSPPPPVRSRPSRADPGMQAILNIPGMMSKLRRELGFTSTGAISQWTRVHGERLLEVERITGIPRHVLRPDICPPPASQRSPADAALSGSRNAALTAAHSVELAR